MGDTAAVLQLMYMPAAATDVPMRHKIRTKTVERKRRGTGKCPSYYRANRTHWRRRDSKVGSINPKTTAINTLGDKVNVLQYAIPEDAGTA